MVLCVLKMLVWYACEDLSIVIRRTRPRRNDVFVMFSMDEAQDAFVGS
jgi:hypothetical protein